MEQRANIVEIEHVERLGDGADEAASRASRLRSRAWHTLAPTVLGMIIDAGDIVSGMVLLAFPVGCLLGFLWSGFLDVSPTWRMVITVATGAYLVAPFTGMIPLATVIGLVVQIFHPKALQKEPFG